MPRVSVVMPTYNCATYLTRAVESVFRQTYDDYEIIIVDDGSTDDTRDVVSAFDSRVQYVWQRNAGVSAARNTAVSKACGEFIAYLDADDIYYPHRLDTQIAFMDAHPECGFVHSDVTIIDDDDRVVHQACNRDTGRSVPQGNCLPYLLAHCHVHMPSVMERYSCFERAGGFDRRLSCAEDYLHWIRVALDGHEVGYIDEPLALYRHRTNSASADTSRLDRGVVDMLSILLEDGSVAESLGEAAERAVRSRMDAIERGLPYAYRKTGRVDLALRTLGRLLRRSPGDLSLYLEIVKTCCSPDVIRRLRTAR